MNLKYSHCRFYAEQKFGSFFAHKKYIRASPRKPRPASMGRAQSRSSDSVQFKIYDRGNDYKNFGASHFKKYLSVDFLCAFYKKP